MNREQANSTVRRSPGAQPQNPAVRLARTLIAQTLAFFAEHETKNLNLVRNRLMELVDDKPSLGQGQNLRSAHLLLGKYAQQFNRGFQQTLADCLAEELAGIVPEMSATGRSQSDDALNGMSLSLLDVGEVERVLLLDRVAQRFAMRYDAVLEPLTQRLSVLFGHDKTSVHDNPFQPMVLLKAFASAWDKCELDAQASEDLVQSLDPNFWIDLTPLYTELNDTLVRAGVSNQRAMRIKHGNSAHAPLGPRSSSMPLTSQPAPLGGPETGRSGFAPMDGGGGQGGGQPRSAWASLDNAGRTVAAHARQFLQRLGFGSQAAAAAQHTGGVHMGTGQAPLAGAEADSEYHTRPNFAAASPALMGYLGDLQAGARAHAESFSYQHQQYNEEALAEHNVLRQMRDRDEIRHAPELDRGTVDALAEVFDFVFADQAIPIQMKFIIGRLQIPVLKAAMIDRDFFLSDQHPARRLVDTLAGASVSWAPEKGEQDPLYVRIEHTVQRVLTEFENDLTLFVDLLREFTEFLFESEQQAQVRVEPVAEQERSGESWDQALEHADELIHERIQAMSAEQAVAPFLLPFLTNQWREVMARAWMDEATREQNYALATKTMEQLIWSIQPKTSAEERRELVAILPEMVRQINLGLDTIEWNGKPRATFTRRLISTHTMAIRLTQSMPLDTGSAALENREGEEALQQLDERRAARQFTQLDDFDAQAQSFKRGMWFDVSMEQGTHIRCRLSWVSPMRTRLLFTNREGFDAFVRSEREVSAMLRLGRIRVLDSEAIVGRALDKIMVGSGDMALAA